MAGDGYMASINTGAGPRGTHKIYSKRISHAQPAYRMKINHIADTHLGLSYRKGMITSPSRTILYSHLFAG
jgi:hypothetical protein